MLVSAVAAVVAALATDLTVFVMGASVAIALLTAVRPVILAAAVDFSSQSESTTLGIVFAMLDGVGALGAICGGVVAEWDLHYAFAFAATVALLSAGIGARFAFVRQVDVAAAG